MFYMHDRHTEWIYIIELELIQISCAVSFHLEKINSHSGKLFKKTDYSKLLLHISFHNFKKVDVKNF